MNAFDEYQEFTRTTAIYAVKCRELTERVTYCVLGLAGEAGEVAGRLSKLVRAMGVSDANLYAALTTKNARDALLAEAGDCLWFIARLADELGVPLSTIAEENKAKLQDRKDRGVIQGNGDER